MFGEASLIAAVDERTDEQEERLAQLIANARYQLEMAEAFGYGSDREYEELFEEVDKVEDRMDESASVRGLLDRVKRSLTELRGSAS